MALSLVIARLATGDFMGARQAVFIFVLFSAAIGVMTPLIKYIGMLGENKAYSEITDDYFTRLTHADLGYFHSNLSGYLTTATRQYVDSCMQFVRTVRDKYIGTVIGIFFPLLVMMYLDLWLGVLALCFGLVQAMYLLWASRIINPHRTRSREIYKKNFRTLSRISSW
jgi:ABC-type multidrug transport system fused ATPase/permease subunit